MISATKNNCQPIIIMGMHRSGTSMITRMLQELGLFIGWDVNDEHEATFFLNRNEKILNIGGGSWHNPNRIDIIFNQNGIQQKLVEALTEDLAALSRLSFLGPKRFIKYRSLLELDFPWGWKDPRNTFLMPLWLEIFSDAKIIHIYRNGLDIARSLVVREEKRIKRLSRGRRNFSDLVQFQASQINHKNVLLFFMQKFQNQYRKLSPLSKYDKFKIHPCISLEAGFELWCNYIEKAFGYIENLPNKILNIRYEDFLLDPEHHLSELQLFCSLPGNACLVKSISSKIKPERRFAFKNEASLLNFYEKVKNNYWMRKLGYGDEYSEPTFRKEQVHV